MRRSNVLWLVFLLLGLVFGAVAVVLLTSSAPGVFGWIAVACSVIILASTAVGYRRSRFRP
ncbi:hypothetical protein ACIPJ2_12915 [Curtobacterium sp. NPDC090217]|uniref:hypothetical protein n=1 Tax=Curtobacterium sp. NPDC090217 TaxID=3363970 RepID=UPI00380FF4AA